MANVTGVPRRPVVLVILDGFGVNPSRNNNGVLEADTPNLDHYFSRYPHTTLQASGPAVYESRSCREVAWPVPKR